jgi:hypothetical protein
MTLTYRATGHVLKDGYLGALICTAHDHAHVQRLLAVVDLLEAARDAAHQQRLLTAAEQRAAARDVHIATPLAADGSDIWDVWPPRTLH